MADDEPEPVTLSIDLRDLRAFVESRADNGVSELALVLTDGQHRIELTGGVPGRSEAAVFGAQRIATAALDYAAGLAMLAMPDET